MNVPFDVCPENSLGIVCKAPGQMDDYILSLDSLVDHVSICNISLKESESWSPIHLLGFWGPVQDRYIMTLLGKKGEGRFYFSASVIFFLRCCDKVFNCL